MPLVEKDDWVARLRSEGEEKDAALEELRTILVRGLTAAIRARYDNRIQADDIVQDALVKILDKLDTFEGRSKFTTWAMTIATRMAISTMRRRHFKDISMSALTKESLKFEPSASPTESTHDMDERDKILGKLRELIDSGLTPKQRDAVHALLNGMPVEVFAEKTGSNRNAVYKLIHDARTKLRRGFEQAGYQAEDINTVFA